MTLFADIYFYQDENGVRHFSNIRKTKHYRIFYREGKRPGLSGHDDFEEFISLAGRRFQVDCSLIKAVIKAESDFNHRAVSKKGAQGLMQLMPQTADLMEVKDPFDPEENIIGGTRYLSLLLKRFDDDKILALAAYNAGPDVVAARRDVPPYPETQTYVKRVLQYYRLYSRETD